MAPELKRVSVFTRSCGLNLAYGPTHILPDLWIGIARRPPRAWWRIHARKMIAAQMGLAAAFPYRCVPFSRLGGFLMLVAMVVALVFGVIVARRFGALVRAERGTA